MLEKYSLIAMRATVRGGCNVHATVGAMPAAVGRAVAPSYPGAALRVHERCSLQLGDDPAGMLAWRRSIPHAH